LLHRHSHKILDIDAGQGASGNIANTVFLMKNINEGRNEAWNNYACYKGNGIKADQHIHI